MTVTFDLLITNATVIDGTGAPRFLADVAVTGERIAEVRRVTAAGPVPDRPTAERVIDASGLVLSPGFIDLHSHADFSIQGHPQATTQLMQGVTTALTGNCGSTPFPTRDLELIRQENAHLSPDFDGDWTDAAGFHRALTGVSPGINIATQVGFSSIRAHVVGLENRAPSPAELAAMQDEIRRAADQGVRGFSSGLIYTPGSYCTPAEIAALARTAAECGLLYSTHIRNESFTMIEAVDEAIRAAEDSGVRLEISHLKAMGPENWGAPARALERIDAARARGLDVAADVYPYTASSTRLTSRLPDFAMDGGKDELLRLLASPGDRARVAQGLAARFGRDVDPDGIVIAELAPAGAEDLSWTIGHSLTEIGDRLGTDPAEAAMRVLAGHDASVAIVNHAMHPDDVAAVLQHPWVSVASDGWTMQPRGAGKPHPRSFGTFARVLGHYVREQGILSLEEAVRKMTGLPAERLRLADRGRVAAGWIADLSLFDPATVTDRSTFDDPWQLATGVRAVFLGGRAAVLDGALTGVRAGRVL